MHSNRERGSGSKHLYRYFFSMKEITVKTLKKFKEILRNHEIKMVERERERTQDFILTDSKKFIYCICHRSLVIHEIVFY